MPGKSDSFQSQLEAPQANLLHATVGIGMTFVHLIRVDYILAPPRNPKLLFVHHSARYNTRQNQDDHAAPIRYLETPTRGRVDSSELWGLPASVSFSSLPLSLPFHFFACLNLRTAKKWKRQSHVRKTLRTYPMETLATQARGLHTGVGLIAV